MAVARIIGGAIQPAIIAITCCRANGKDSLLETAASYLNKLLYVSDISDSLLLKIMWPP